MKAPHPHNTTEQLRLAPVFAALLLILHAAAAPAPLAKSFTFSFAGCFAHESEALIDTWAPKGDLNAGYTCQIGFSPNGRYITSGDGEGRLFFWDWKSTKILRKFKAHDNGPCIGNVWHPIEPSWCITCGWDSQIKLWD